MRYIEAIVCCHFLLISRALKHSRLANCDYELTVTIMLKEMLAVGYNECERNDLRK
jgi:hypothetical protein